MKYTWEQIEEALSVAGVNPAEFRNILAETVDYRGRADQGVDPAGQEKLEPRAPAEKHWFDRHEIQVFDPAPETQDGTEKRLSTTMAPEPSVEGAPKPETTMSFDRIRRMMS